MVELVTAHDVHQDIMWGVVVGWLMLTTHKLIVHKSPQALSLMKTKELDDKASYVVKMTWGY